MTGDIKYEQLHDGGSFEVSAKGERIRFACCDCGLVHRIAFAVEKNGNIGIALRRDKVATRARRRSTQPVQGGKA